MANKYFKSALVKAIGFLGNRGRLLALLFQLMQKINRNNLRNTYWKEKLFLIGRLLKAYAVGKYRHVSTQTILLVIAAVIYFINPLDLIPDVLLGIGLTDDLAVLTGVYNIVSNELSKFEKWEGQLS